MAEDIRFRIRVRTTIDGADELVSLSAIPACDDQLKKQWIGKISELMLSTATEPNSGASADGPGSDDAPPTPRPWDIVLGLDGSVAAIADAAPPDAPTSGVYPPPYRIPPATIADDDLSPRCRVQRQELFAYGTLLYEIGHGRTPFAGLDARQAQRRYARAAFPDDVKALPWELFVAVLAAWSVEFSQTFRPLQPPPPPDPVLAALQVAGVALCIGAALFVPVLGAVGFGALGPVAGSLATAWQSSMGSVAAGSLFAWCQSAAMGGAAASAIAATGAVGGGVAAAATAVGAAAGGHHNDDERERLFQQFKSVCRNVDTAEDDVTD